jgi:thioredoxin reductase
MTYDVIIVGGGPAGLAAALTLGRARRRVLLCDSGPPRNAAAVHVQGFLTRDGTPPTELRRIGREQLRPYETVEVRDVRVEEILGERGAFEVRLATGSAHARRILLCTGMIDDLPDIDGYRALWGKSIFQCPYCHGWESRDRAFAYLAPSAETLDFALLLRAWTSDVVALTNAAYPVPAETRARLEAASIPLDERRITRLRAASDHLEAIELADGEPLRRDVLFAHPPQRQVPLVQSLGLALDPSGFVAVDPMVFETSRPGIHAAGDLQTFAQAAIAAAASGMLTAARLNHGLMLELSPQAAH